MQAEGEQKLFDLARMIKQADWQRVMVFCNTKYMADRLAKRLKAREIDADCLHGDMSQGVRNKVMRAFKEGKLSVLVAMDVAARGIDVEDIDAVINFDIPKTTLRICIKSAERARQKRRRSLFVCFHYRTGALG